MAKYSFPSNPVSSDWEGEWPSHGEPHARRRSGRGSRLSGLRTLRYLDAVESLATRVAKVIRFVQVPQIASTLRTVTNQLLRGLLDGA